MHILAICGSLRASSSNRAVLEAARRLSPSGIDVHLFEGLADLPAFNPDTEQSGLLPPAAASLRAEVEGADALLISSPEYAHGIAGSFKNLLDWMVGSTRFPGTPVGLINCAPRAHHALDQTVEILRTMSADLVADAILTLDVSGFAQDAAAIAADPASAHRLRGLIATLAARHALRLA